MSGIFERGCETAKSEWCRKVPESSCSSGGLPLSLGPLICSTLGGPGPSAPLFTEVTHASIGEVKPIGCHGKANPGTSIAAPEWGRNVVFEVVFQVTK
jgi:hypothetical protein